MRMNKFFVLVTVTLFTWTHSQAQQLYKCGATFQDKPCETEVQKKYSAVTGSFSKEQVTTSADSQCADHGSDVVPIIQARLANETQDSMNAKIDAKPIGRQEKIRQKELVIAVFTKKGNATEIRGAIESECMEKKTASKNRVATVSQNSSSGASIFHRTDVNAARAAADAARVAADAARRSR